jgi:hypothetical protein
MKTKNPLYVVKGKDVQEANNIFDLVIKKFNLEPVMQFLQNIFKMLLAQATSYPVFLVVKKYIDEVMAKCIAMMGRFGIA